MAFLIISAGCSETPPIPTQHVLDTQFKEMREYELIDKEKIIFKYKESHPMNWGKDSYGNGFVCAPQLEVAAWYEYLRNHKLNCK